MNIFNTACVYADRESATDDNFIRVEKVIGHEYFHNWTGNRVTVKNWFQLTLKEGLTVFRDQEFTSDLHSRVLHRIETVTALRTLQFREDAGPLAHPIRPRSYTEMNNFYTSTVYEKGAEIIRMLHTLLGKKMFPRGIATYFELFDGRAVSCEDFLEALEEASGRDLTLFKRWYDQKGTPVVTVNWTYDEAKQELLLITEQSNPTEGENAEPLYFPFVIGLIDSSGKDLPVDSLLILKDKKQTFRFENIPSKPTVSLNRDFSAPVIVKAPYVPKDFLFLMTHDSNGFNRWEASREFSMKILLDLVADREAGKDLVPDESYTEVFGKIIKDASLDPALKAVTLSLPSESLMAQEQKIIAVENNHLARSFLLSALAERHFDPLLALYEELSGDVTYSLTPESTGKRKLKHVVLSYLMRTKKPEITSLCFHQFRTGNNMTDIFSALECLSRTNTPQREEALRLFYEKWEKDPLVMVKWFAVQALSPEEDTLARVKKLSAHPLLDYTVPNLVRGLIGSFAENLFRFHAEDGSGYLFMEERIAHIDTINPQVAARLSGCFKSFPKLPPLRKRLMHKMLHRLLQRKGLSSNTYEILSSIVGSHH